MKKLLTLISLLGAFSLQAVEGPEPIHLSESFLTVRSLVVSNTISATNLTIVDGVLGVNPTGLIYTNLYGTRFVVTASAYTNVNVFRTIPLYSLRDGTGPWRQNTDTTNTVSALIPFANISVTLVGGSGANAATAFVFTPVYDGDYASTATGDDFSFSVTPNTTTTVTVATNLPIWRWPGAAALTVKSVTAGDTDANSPVTIKALKLNAWRPK